MLLMPCVTLKGAFIYLLKITMTLLYYKIITKCNVKYCQTLLKKQKGLILIDTSLILKTKLNLPGIL